MTLQPDLISAVMKACFEFAIEFKGGTIEDWKPVNWTDGISVILDQRQDNNQILSTVKEGKNPDSVTIWERYNRFTEFLFYKGFLYD